MILRLKILYEKFSPSIKAIQELILLDCFFNVSSGMSLSIYTIEQHLLI